MSLTGFRKTNRYESIEVEYFDKEFKKQDPLNYGLFDLNRYISRARNQ